MGIIFFRNERKSVAKDHMIFSVRRFSQMASFLGHFEKYGFHQRLV